MTIKDLEQLKYLKQAFENLSIRIIRLRESADIQSPRLDGMPHGTGVKDKIGNIVPEIADSEKELEEQLTKLKTKLKEINDWVRSLPDIRAQLLIQLHYEDGMTWEDVAAWIGDPRATGNGHAVYLRRYMQKMEKAQKGKDAHV